MFHGTFSVPDRLFQTCSACASQAESGYHFQAWACASRRSYAGDHDRPARMVGPRGAERPTPAKLELMALRRRSDSDFGYLESANVSLIGAKAPKSANPCFSSSTP